MKTLKDIIDYVLDEPRPCVFVSCVGCSKFNWCYVETYLLSLDYLYKGEY